MRFKKLELVFLKGRDSMLFERPTSEADNKKLRTKRVWEKALGEDRQLLVQSISLFFISTQFLLKEKRFDRVGKLSNFAFLFCFKFQQKIKTFFSLMRN